MASAKGAEVCLAAPGAWTPRRIAFHATSTFSSAPAMEPLNEPVTRVVGGGESVAGENDRVQHQQQQHVPSKLGKSELISLPSSMPLHWTAPLKIGAGLSNLGNTCFLNSVLQCLTYTPPLAGYLLSGQHKASCRVAGFCAFCALQEHVQQALASSGKVVSPQKLAKNLRCISRSFRMGRQEDSHEYMRYLLEALHKCCLPPDLAKNSNSKPSQEKSLVYRIFGGQLRSQVKCTVCSHCSNTYDPFLDLSLEIVRADSLVKALSRFTAVDVLDGDNKYRCIRCKKKVRALKNFTIETVPNILTIQFKRFSSTGGQGGKIDKKVDFETTLDLKPFVSNVQENVPKYKLFGVLVHSGWSTHSGHYYCFLRASSDIWHVFDDTRVRQVSERTVLEQKAYMLFYVREVKRPNNSNSEANPKLALSQPLNVLPKEKERNAEAAGNPYRSVFQPVVASSKEKESLSVSEVAMEKVPSGHVTVITEEKQSDPRVGGISRSTMTQPASVVSAKPLQAQDALALQSLNGVSVSASTTAMNGSDHDVVPPIVSPESSRRSDDAAGGLSASVAEQDVPEKDIEDKDVEMENCCTSGNTGLEDDWDEYYKKGWNASGSTPPPKFLKMLREIPHTRRYYQARAVAVRRSSKVVSVANGELEMENPEASEILAANTKRDPKRQHPGGEEMHGSKRQQREFGHSSIDSMGLASEESTDKVDAMEMNSSNGGPIVQESSLQERLDNKCEENAVLSDCHGSKVDELRIVQRPVAGGNGRSEINGHVDTSHDHLEQYPQKRELQCSGAELRVYTKTESNGQLLERGECGGENINMNKLSSSEKGTETVNGTALLMTSNDLYGSGVSRWGEVDADKSVVKEIDRLLEQERETSVKQDIWDLEYDRGKSKKVRNKTNREAETEIGSNGTVIGTVNGVVNGLVKPSNGVGNGMPKAGNGFCRPGNPFQAFGFAKQYGNGLKAGNSFGFKSGYGFKSGHGNVTKVGKNVGSMGPQIPKRID